LVTSGRVPITIIALTGFLRLITGGISDFLELS
jgi:hypothetical protein